MIPLLLTPSKVDYKGTITGLRISAVDGTAFIDNANASVTALADGNHSIEIYDSSNRMLKGVLKAAGTSEGLDSELISSWTNGASLPFNTTWTSSGVDITSAISTTNARCSASVDVSSLRLYKYTGTFTLNSGAFSYMALASNFAGAVPAVVLFSGTSGNKTLYTTAINDSQDYLAIYATGASNFSLTSNSLKQVLTPSATGVTIVSAKAGGTYNFSYKNPSFAYNSSSYYCIIKPIR